MMTMPTDVVYDSQSRISRQQRPSVSRWITATLIVLGLASGIAACSPQSQSPSSNSAAQPRPILVVPRFNGGSEPTTDSTEFWYRRGFPANELRLGVTYDPLLATLRSGHPQAAVIGAGYDWRMEAAPPQDTVDGLVTGLREHWNDPTAANTFVYAVDYLRYWLIQAATAQPESDHVDVVAHSTGASVVRAYLQSDAYGQDVLGPDGKTVRLPRIGRLILAAPPQQGAPFVWNLWNGNFASFVGAPRGSTVFQGYDRAYRHVLNGGEISGPTSSITKSDLTGSGLTRQVSFLRLYNPLFRLVLPTYPFLSSNDARQEGLRTINNDPANRNELLLDLNATSAPGSNPWARLADSVIATYPIHVLAAPDTTDTSTVLTTVADQEKVGPGGVVVPFTAFDQPTQRGVPTVAGQRWYREIFEPNAGDGAFPIRSMQDYFFDAQGNPDPLLRVQQWGNGPGPTGTPKAEWVSANGNLSHNLFIENNEITSWIAGQISAG